MEIPAGTCQGNVLGHALFAESSLGTDAGTFRVPFICPSLVMRVLCSGSPARGCRQSWIGHNSVLFGQDEGHCKEQSITLPLLSLQLFQYSITTERNWLLKMIE